MKNSSKKIIMSVLTLVLTIVALGTTTFAWFSIGTVSKVSNITGTVTSGDSLEVRLNHLSATKATDWKANLTGTDVSDFIADIFGGKFLDAVTSENGTSFTKMGIAGNGNVELGHNATANTDYIEFDIEFRSQSDGFVDLTGLEFILGTDNTLEIDGGDYTQITGVAASSHDVVSQAAYGARISFDGTTFQYKDATNPIKVDSGQIINNYVQGEIPIEAGQWSYLIDSKQMDIYKNSSNTKVTSGDFGDIDLVKAYGHEELVDGTPRVTVALTTSGPSNPPVMGDYTAKLTVRIWIEGWDADTYDSIYNTVLNIAMVFEKRES